MQLGFRTDPYFGQPVSQQHLTNKMVVDRIVRETSLSVGDVSNVLISLGVIVRDALELGQRVDLADLGSLCIIVSPVMMNSEEEVTVEKALKTPKIVFTPKSSMRSAANSVELHIVKKRKTISRKVRRKEKVQDLLLYQRIRK